MSAGAVSPPHSQVGAAQDSVRWGIARVGAGLAPSVVAGRAVGQVAVGDIFALAAGPHAAVRNDHAGPVHRPKWVLGDGVHVETSWKRDSGWKLRVLVVLDRTDLWCSDAQM
jgi:hypothetical protein